MRLSRMAAWLSIACLLLSGGCAKKFGGAAVPAASGARELTSAEAKVQGQNGFVISREETSSFHLGYTAAFRAHQRVYFTADAFLHAWHASYDTLLSTLETSVLAPELNAMLAELRGALAKSSAPAEARGDVALFVDVAASLASGTAVSKEAAPLFKQAEAAAGEATITLFGDPMSVDLSQMKPRGHYTQSKELERYFRAMMWLGRTEVRLAKKDAKAEAWNVNRRAVRGLALFRALFTPRAERAWHVLDDATNALAGPPDSMSLPGYDRATKGLDLATASDEAIVAAFDKESTQKIGSQLLPPKTGDISFLPLGQRYVFDSHVLSAVTYGALKTYRMMPSPLDVAYAVFDNPMALELLGKDLADPEYREALTGIAKRRDAMGPELWEGSLHHLWLSAIRALSPDRDKDKSLPAPMQSPAWEKRLLNTQLASWAELRHDNLLYAKQSYTAVAMCEYPDAYVDPYPAFFTAMAKMAEKGRVLAATLPFQGGQGARVLAYFERVGAIATRLADMAARERRNEPLTSEQLDFMNHMVSIDGKHAGCTTVWEPHGWYADLHYSADDVLMHKPTIADVHTQPTDEAGNPVGKVLHVATGRPRMFSVTIQTCVGPREYRGFVSSYDEVVTKEYQRLTDEEWSAKLGKNTPSGYVTSTPVDVPWLTSIVAP